MAGGRKQKFGLKHGALSRALERHALPSARADDAALLSKLRAFAGSKPVAFTAAEEETLIARGLAFRHDQPAPCLILTHAGWRAAASQQARAR